jgi:4-azaleucine resistance transporter AzlC
MLRAEVPAPSRSRSTTEFLRGFRDILPIIVATIPFGMVFGTLSANKGLSVAESILMSGAVYGGASQFVALELWANPLPFWTILLSALAVNLRHVLYSAALGRRMNHWSPLERYCGFTFLTDPVFALAEERGGERLSVPYYFGLAVPLYLNWIVTTALGFIVGNLIGRPEALGLDFVVTAYFMFLVVGYRTRPNALPIIGASAAAALLAYVLVGPPWHFAGGATVGMALAALLAKPKAAA